MIFPEPKKAALSVAGSAVLAFGLYNVHALSGVTEGGVLGMTLLLNHWLKVSPAWTGLIMNALCYGLGWKLLGRSFILYSILSGGGFSLFYAVFECFPPLWPALSETPLIAAVLGAVFVGVGVGLCVRAGGAPSGDDALAMCLRKLTGMPLRRAYLLTDLTVLGLSVSYIPPKPLACSLVTVVLSGRIIGLLQPKKEQ